MSTFSWAAEVYSKFLSDRTRPVYDLISRLPKDFSPEHCLDLGCGPGNSTGALQLQYPNSKIQGFDLSEDMLTKAKLAYPNIEFIQQDIAQFEKPESVDLIFSNAALQWLDHHEIILAHYASHLAENGILAVQMPNNFHRPAHQLIISTLEKKEAWKPCLARLRYPKMNAPLYSAMQYDHLLMQAGLSVLAIWEINYFIRMPDHQGIVDWMRGTGLRPVLSNLSESEQNLFLQHYTEGLKQAYPLSQDGSLLFSFRRLFFIARKIKQKDSLRV